MAEKPAELRKEKKHCDTTKKQIVLELSLHSEETHSPIVKLDFI